MDQMPENNAEAAAGAAVYNPAILNIYDLYVLGFSNRFVWQCPTELISGFLQSTHHGQSPGCGSRNRILSGQVSV